MINPKLLKFLRGIKKHNEKDWYDAHKEEYKALKNEFVCQLEALGNQIAEFDPAIRRARKAGISTVKVFRLHRDTRFSKDKTKYKTYISGYIAADINDSQQPVYYLSISPDRESFIGGGIHMPEREQLDAIREYIATHYKKLQKIIADKALRKYFPHGLSSEHMLKKGPQGYDLDHPAIELLKYKSFTVGRSLTKEDLANKKFFSIITKEFSALQSFNEFMRNASK